MQYTVVASSELYPKVETSGNTVTTTWTPDDKATEYRIIYHYKNNETSVMNVSETSHTVTERIGQRVYTVSVQALSIHLPSTIAGPVTARGMIELYDNTVVNVSVSPV